MVKTPKTPAGHSRKEWPGDLGQPIVVPFRGMPGDTNLPTSDDPRGWSQDGLLERFEKLIRLADHYGIERKGDPGWGLLLAYQIASDLHPGFVLVYDHWH